MTAYFYNIVYLIFYNIHNNDAEVDKTFSRFKKRYTLARNTPPPPPPPPPPPNSSPSSHFTITFPLHKNHRASARINTRKRYSISSPSPIGPLIARKTRAALLPINNFPIYIHSHPVLREKFNEPRWGEGVICKLLSKTPILPLPPIRPCFISSLSPACISSVFTLA